MIGRIWRGVIRAGDRETYVRYVLDTGVAGYLRTPGNLGAQVLTRDLPGGRVEVLAVSTWESLDALHGFVGDDLTAVVLYPEDRRFLLDGETSIAHYEVSGPAPRGRQPA